MRKFIAGTFATLVLFGAGAQVAQAADTSGDHSTTAPSSYGKATEQA